MRRLLTVLGLLAGLATAGPAAAAAGDPVSLEGTFVVVHEDPATPAAAYQGHEYRYFLRSRGEHRELRFHRRPAFAPRQRIRVQGTDAGAAVDVQRARALRPSPASAASGEAAAAVTGTDDVLVLLVTSTSPDGVTPASASNLVGTQGGAWYRETSYGQFGLRATASPWLTIPQQAAGCPIYDYLQAATTAARAKGIEPDAYERVMVYMGPGAEDCRAHAAGWGEVDGRHSWIVLGYMDRRVTLHEVGHNIGLWHSHSLMCRDAGGRTVALSDTCDPFDEYGDPWDAMGGGFLGQGHFNAQQKEHLGWVANRVVAVPGPVPSARTLTLSPFETTTGTKALVVRTPRPFWFEYRRPIGNDAFLSQWPQATGGVLVHIPEPGNGTHVLDMTPVTGEETDRAALPPGASYTDPGGGFVLRVNAVASSGASVTVGPGPATPFGYVWADQPAATSYTPATAQANSTGALNTVARTGTGAYTVTLPGVGRPGGVVHVTAHGTGSETCQALRWAASGGAERVDVRCFTASGTPVNTRFLASYTATAPPDGAFAHLKADQPSRTTAYTPAIQYGTLGAGTVTRTSAGTYEARLAVPSASAGTVHVTALGAAARTCQVAGWRPIGAATEVVAVRCFNPAGTRVDTAFALTYAHGVGMLGVRGRAAAYVLVGDPSARSVTPAAAYSLNTAGATNTVTRTGTGAYTVRMPAVGAAGRGHAQATPYGSDGNRCKVASFGRSGADQLVNVVCTTPAGMRADTRFTASWTE